MKKLLGLMLLALPVFAAPLFAQRTAIFPRLASGAGWTSQFSFNNQGISAVNGILVQFIAYNDQGARVPVTTNLGTSQEFTINLLAGRTQIIRVTPGVDFVQGFVLVEYPDFDNPIRAAQVFRFESNGVVLVEVGVPQQELGDHFSFPVEINPNPANRVFPAIAISNPLAEAQTIVATLMDSNGVIQNTALVEMEPEEHIAGYLDQGFLFPGLNNSTFTGSVSFSSPFGVGVLTLRQDKDAFGGVPTDGGPMLAPFVVSTPFLTEVEHNDFFEEAQPITLPVQVNGEIEFLGDWDFFSFNGIAGQILTVMSDRTGLPDSVLDSVIQVHDSNLIPIAFNDQNGLAPGLYPSNDSFIQVVLPATGTYFIAIRDFFELDGGGANGFEYNLHIKVR
jgi:hypothetical protein